MALTATLGVERNSRELLMDPKLDADLDRTSGSKVRSSKALPNEAKAAMGEQIRTPVPVSPHSSLAIHRRVLKRLQNFVLYSSLLFSTGYKSVDLLRSVWKRSLLIVQP